MGYSTKDSEPFEEGFTSCLLSEHLLLTSYGKIKKEPSLPIGRNSSKKVLEMLVECSLKKFSVIYLVGVLEDETMWDNMDIDDS